MKGIVFTEFIEMVESRFSIATSERLLETTELASEGVYTSVGTYDAGEMIALVSNLSATTGMPVADLLREFGHHLFLQFVKKFPDFFRGISSSFDFLSRVDRYVHVEVRKLYPDAELPSFACERPAPGRLVMVYHSSRNLPDLAEGLIRGCVQHFEERVDLHREVVDGDPLATRFELLLA